MPRSAADPAGPSSYHPAPMLDPSQMTREQILAELEQIRLKAESNQLKSESPSAPASGKSQMLFQRTEVDANSF